MNKQRQANTPPKSPGRPKGIPNKRTALLKDAILQAADKAGDKAGMVGYLTKQAKENPAAFLTLLGKVLPLQITGKDGGAIDVNATISPASKVRDMVKQIAERS